MSISLEMGPILYFAEATSAKWSFFVRLLVRADSEEEARQCTLEFIGVGANIEAACEVVHSFADLAQEPEQPLFWVGWKVSVKRRTAEQRLSYTVTVGGTTTSFDQVAVPRKGYLPRIAFFSCNGVDDDRKFLDLDDPYGLWKEMRTLHNKCLEGADRDNRSGFHLLIGGGDQIYCDSVWHGPLNAYEMMTKADRAAAHPEPGLSKELERFYLTLYRDRWSRSHVGAMKARVPCIFTWDDHDIFDGWGSYEPKEQGSPLYKMIFEAAQRAFSVFQLGDPKALKSGHAMQVVRIPGDGSELGILLLDTRTERSRSQILSKKQWDDMGVWLKEFADKPRVARHLLVVSAVPVIHLRPHLQRFSAPFGLEDDRRDGWEHESHVGDRAHLLNTLLLHANQAACATTILSGDVHVAAWGRVESVRPAHLRPGAVKATIQQLTSSAIGHPPPGAVTWLGLQTFTSDDTEPLTAGVTDVHTCMISMRKGERCIRSRNFLTLGFDEDKGEQPGDLRMWAQWFTEKYKALSTQVVTAAPRPT